MAFGKISKQDLIDAGLDPDKFSSLIGTAVTKEELTAMRTEMNTTLTGIQTALAELTTKLTTRSSDDGSNGNEGSNGNRGNNDGGNGNGNGNNNQPPDMFAVDPIEFATDPGSHLKKVAGAIVNDSRVSMMGMRRDNAYDKLSSSLPWFKNGIIKSEIDDKWKKYTPQVMVQFNMDPMSALQEIYDSVVGKHHDEIIQDKDKKDGKFNLVQVGGSNRTDDTGGNNERPAKDQLNAQELAAAASFGMTPEEYLKEQNDLVAAGKYTRA